MKVTRQNLMKLNRLYRGYLEGKRVDGFFREYGIRFAAGHWCAGDFCDRFAPPGYMSDDPSFDTTVLGQIERVAAAGIEGIEFHESVFLNARRRVDREKVEAVKKAVRKHHVKPTNMNNNTWTDPRWKLGGVTHPDRKLRREALALVLQSVDLAVEMGCTSVALWPGSDGWDYNFERNYGQLNEDFLRACVAVNRKAKKAGLRFGIEAKLHEPREGNMVVATTQKAMLIASEVNRRTGGRNMGIAIDYGHEQMYGYEPADNLYTARLYGVPVVNFHINTSKLHSNDEDRVTGTGDIWRMTDFCYAAVDTGYAGWFGEDQFTYRMEPVKAMSLSRELFANVMKKALLIYADKVKLEAAQKTGDAGRTIDVVKRVLLG